MTKEEQWVLEEKYGGELSPRFELDKARLAQGEPVAYVIGWQPFLGLKIYLDSKPLIPRPETENWVEQFCQHLSAGNGSAEPLRVLDLCAGSGAVGCAILKNFPTARVSFGEVDPAHEATIRKNIKMNDLVGRSSDVRIGDLFAPFADERFDYVLANPPYIPEERPLEASVARHEPALALRSGADGLDLIRRIAEGLRRHLAPAGQAWVECDSEHAEAARALFAERGFQVRIEKDQFGRERLLVIS